METTEPTSEPAGEPTIETAEPTAPPEKHLFRSRSDRMIAGVAGGLGEYFDLDPVLFRIGFALLAVFGGGGVLLYALGWLLLPEQGSHRSLLRASGRHRRAALVVVLVIVALSASGPWDWGWHWRLWSWPLVLVVGGIALLFSSRTHSGEHVPWSPSSAPASPPVDAPYDYVPPAPPTPRPASLTPYLLGALAVVGGVAALTGLSMTAALAIALLLTGGAVVGAAVRGRVGATPVVAILIGLALASSLIAPRGLGDGIGNRTFQPQSGAELQRNYRLGIGHLVLDLTHLSSAGTTVGARLGIGQLVVLVPANAGVRVHEHVGMGSSEAFGSRQGGVSVDRTNVDPASGPPQFTLDLSVGIGQVEVQRAAA